ncbi:flagellar export protein FliJ [Shouchella sp. JSM 1781072]|uniref:flagellar export protein FliJ n=1 Tax=Bacillaceae TaxID=186817 RepID=UPI000C08A565|nr:MULTISPECIES: flagellar export protein FliJ [Bacillaceae]UTR04769.1 flagellar export protein FliJ [Alkalihalobacillus sp. LMS6]
MTFSFSLQQAMNVKNREKHQARKRFDDAQREFEVVATSFYELLKEKERLERNMEERQLTGVRIDQYVSQNVYLSRLEKTISEKKVETDGARKKMLEQEIEYKVRAKSYKQFERLKQRQAQQHEADERKREQQQMDEVSISQFNRAFV